MTAIVSLLLVLVLSLSVTRIAAVALRLTGMSNDAARFQARSAFTGCGYTTRESEQVAAHPVRRRIAGWLMIAGNLQIAAVSGTLILSMLGISEEASAQRVVTLVLGLLLVYLLANSRIADGALCGATSWLLKRYTTLETRDFSSVLHLGSDFTVEEVSVGHGHPLADRPLGASVGLGGEVVVLGIVREDGEYEGLPGGETVVMAHDTLVVYGRTARVEGLRAGTGPEEAGDG